MRAQGIEQWDEIYPDRATFEQDVVEGTLYLAVEQQGCCGICVLNEHQDPTYATIPWSYCEGKVLVVHRLAVDPQHQGRGIASQLMLFAEAYGRAHGYRTIRLDAFCKNPSAVRLYTKSHYRLAGTGTMRKGPFYCFEKCLDHAESAPAVSPQQQLAARDPVE
jgi:ribosomal protein S18 acetylase RimI-like enzyme